MRGHCIMIEITGLHKSFGKNEVLHGISLKIPQGSVTAVLGPSGSGKSTLLRCINMLETPQSGTLRLNQLQVDFASVHKKDILRLRQDTAMVFQSFNLFAHKTALENVAEGLIVVKKMSKKTAHAQAMQYLEKVGLTDRAGYFPTQLSGGQQQRVAIARALAMNPKVILFDEPTSALDPELVQEVLTVMKKISLEGITMIVVTHELGFAREVATDIVFMDDGRIVEQSAPQIFFNNPAQERTRQFLRQIAPYYNYQI